jgi:hypothetical protein
VGAYLGRILLRPSGATKRDWVLGLLVGLLILGIVGFIPYLGGLVRLGVICLGLGAFAAQLYRTSRLPIRREVDRPAFWRAATSLSLPEIQQGNLQSAPANSRRKGDKNRNLKL